MAEAHQATNPHADIYGVGNPHPHAAKLPPQSGMLAHCQPSGITLHVLLEDCTDADVRAFQAVERKFGLLSRGIGYIWLMRDGVATLDAPYCPGIELPENQALPWNGDALAPETRAAISIVLADEHRIVRALSYVSVSPDFTRKLTSMHARSLARAPASRAAWDAEVDSYCRAYPSPQEAFKHAAVVCKGGT